MQWTEEQKQVIAHRRGNALVSAAAGSGKTAVLVERVLQMLLDPEAPVLLDRLLIVTFTNAAAAQMKEKIRDRLQQAAEQAPDNPFIQEQMDRMAQAMQLQEPQAQDMEMPVPMEQGDLAPAVPLEDAGVSSPSQPLPPEEDWLDIPSEETPGEQVIPYDELITV